MCHAYIKTINHDTWQSTAYLGESTVYLDHITKTVASRLSWPWEGRGPVLAAVFTIFVPLDLLPRLRDLLKSPRMTSFSARSPGHTGSVAAGICSPSPLSPPLLLRNSEICLTGEGEVRS